MGVQVSAIQGPQSSLPAPSATGSFLPVKGHPPDSFEKKPATREEAIKEAVLDKKGLLSDLGLTALAVGAFMFLKSRGVPISNKMIAGIGLANLGIGVGTRGVNAAVDFNREQHPTISKNKNQAIVNELTKPSVILGTLGILLWDTILHPLSKHLPFLEALASKPSKNTYLFNSVLAAGFLGYSAYKGAKEFDEGPKRA